MTTKFTTTIMLDLPLLPGTRFGVRGNFFIRLDGLLGNFLPFSLLFIRNLEDDPDFEGTFINATNNNQKINKIVAARTLRTHF